MIERSPACAWCGPLDHDTPKSRICESHFQKLSREVEQIRLKNNVSRDVVAALESQVEADKPQATPTQVARIDALLAGRGGQG